MTEPADNRPDQGKKLFFMSILSGLIWILIGWLIISFFQENSFTEVLGRGSHYLIQTATGLLAGSLIGLAGVAMIRLPAFKKVLEEYAIMREVKRLSLTTNQILYVSLIAGVSEEILFRGAIQPVIGIWWTSLLFIGIHGYIRIQTTTHILFTLFTFFLSMVLGVLSIWFGLIAAMAAHFIYDVIVLVGIKRLSDRQN